MADIDYNNRYFIGVENYEDGDLTADTVFHYRQQGGVVWGTFEGGNALHGNLVARASDDGRLDMVWHYLNGDGDFVSGVCLSTPEVLDDGRLRLHESWKIDGSQIAGTSVIEEIRS